MTVAAIIADFPGVRRVFEEGVKLGHWSLSHVDDPLPDADLYILGAWDPRYGAAMRHAKALGARVWVLWTSSMGEVGFEPAELEQFGWLLENGDVDKIWCGSPSLARVASKTFFAPYPVEFKLGLVREKRDEFGLFAPATTKKNLANQFLAARFIQEATLRARAPGLGFVTNVTAARPTWYCPRWMDLVVWMDRPAYEDRIGRLRLFLAVSWAETHAYGAQEAVLNHTPVLASRAVPWLQGPSVAPNDPGGIAMVGLQLLEHPGGIVARQQDALAKYAARGLDQIREAFSEHGVAL